MTRFMSMGGMSSLCGVSTTAVDVAVGRTAGAICPLAIAGGRGVVGGRAMALGCSKQSTSFRWFTICSADGNVQSFTLVPETLASRLLKPKKEVLWW